MGVPVAAAVTVPLNENCAIAESDNKLNRKEKIDFMLLKTLMFVKRDATSTPKNVWLWALEETILQSGTFFIITTLLFYH